MKTIKMKLITGILACSLFTAMVIGCLAIMNSTGMSRSDARDRMQLTGRMQTGQINSTIQKIEQSVNTLSELVMQDFDFASFQKSKTYADTYTKSIEETVMELANHTDGAITAYVRYNPQYSNPTSGVFTQRESLKDEFQLLTPTDFSMYEEGDVEHVGWYYLPVQAKKPIWMDPYLNANINVYMISYVVPLYAEDGTSIGIVGMDIDFGRITDQVDATTVGSTGYAFLTDAQGGLVHHKGIKETAMLADMDASLSDIMTVLADESQQGESIGYVWQGVKKQLTYYNLDNGMKMVLTAPTKEIYAEAYRLGRMIAVAVLIAFVLSGVVGVFVGTGITKPIHWLTTIIDQTAKLDFRTTKDGKKLRQQKDELGDIAKEIHVMRVSLRDMMHNLNEAEKSLHTNLEDLNGIMKQNSIYAEDNSASTEELAAGMQETSANATNIVHNIEEVKRNTQSIYQLAVDGEQNSNAVQARAIEMEQLSRESRSKADQMYAVMKQKTDIAVEQSNAVKKINDLTESIKQISSKTNLLALNASIEAARAGEAGRGFAVVASEIGNLASQTLQTVNNIDEIVGTVNEAVNNMSESLVGVMDFLEKTVLGDYEEFSRVGGQYLADAGEFQQKMGQTKNAMGELEKFILKIADAIAGIDDMVSQSTQGITGIAEKSGETQNSILQGIDKLQECEASVAMLEEIVKQFRLE